MSELANLRNDLRLETSLPAASLESILCTEELLRRPWRPPDHEKENSALVALACALADSPRTILQTLADKVLDVLQADSAGLSLLTKEERSFYWPAIAGAWRPHIGGGTPRDFGPCGDVLDRNVPMLFTHWERRYPYLSIAVPLADEGLLVPFYVNGNAVGTIWAIAHNDRRKFDAEDLRLLESMGRFASAAYQAVKSIEDLQLDLATREVLSKVRSELAHMTRVTSLGALTASIAHEINQPLGGISSNAGAALRWIRREKPDLGEAVASLEHIIADSHRASDIITSLRAMFKKDTDERSSVEINDLILAVLAIVRRDLQRKGVELQTELKAVLPAIAGNKVQLQQVLLNLVVNATEAMHSVQHRVLTVKSELSKRDMVRVSIKDTGTGVDPSDLDRIFKPLFTTKMDGMGLGLSICHSIIESHGGRIWVSTVVGGGSMFQFELPVISRSP